MSPVRLTVAFTLVRHMFATFTTIRVAETAALRGPPTPLDELLGDRGIDADELVAEYNATRREAQK